MGFYSCVKNSDDVVTPPPPEEEVDLKPEDVYGKWQVYYSTKLVIENPGTGTSKPYTTFRSIDLDGFTFEMYTENGEYLVKGYNGIGVQTSQGWYEIKDKDSLILHLDSVSPSMEIIPLGERRGRRILREPKDGIIKWDETYGRVSKDKKTEYRVTDVFASRDVNVNPTTTDGVNPAKAKINYDDMCRGRWVVSEVYIYYDNTLQPLASAEKQKLIKGTIYDYSIGNGGEKKLKVTYPGTAENPGYSEEFPVYITDDVLTYTFVNGKGEDDAFNSWIERFENNNNTYYDITSMRFDNDVSVVYKSVWRFDREL